MSHAGFAAVNTPDESAFRTDPPDTGSERELLQGFLDFHRGTLLWKCAGLTGEQLAKASTEPSTMSLLGRSPTIWLATAISLNRASHDHTASVF
jgi:hypothetical protein